MSFLSFFIFVDSNESFRSADCRSEAASEDGPRHAVQADLASQ